MEVVLCQPKPPRCVTYPRVTVQLPIYNERAMITALIESVISLDWPKDQLIFRFLMTSTDETSTICDELKQRYEQLSHHKQTALVTSGCLTIDLRFSAEFIAIFDSDFRPQADFLRQLMPSF